MMLFRRRAKKEVLQGGRGLLPALLCALPFGVQPRRAPLYALLPLRA